MLEAAIGFPRRDDDWVKTVAIGGLCIIFSFLVLPALLLQGYLMRVLREGGGDAAPPRFDDLGSLLVDGLKAVVVQFAYALVPVALLVTFAAAVGISVTGLDTTESADAGAGLLLGLVGLVGVAVVLVVTLVAIYLVPAALALVARTGRIGAAFDLGTLKRVGLTSEYLVGFLLYVVVVLVGQIVGAVLVFVFLLGLFVIFYVQVAGYYLLATAVDRALAAAD